MDSRLIDGLWLVNHIDTGHIKDCLISKIKLGKKVPEGVFDITRHSGKLEVEIEECFINKIE